MSANRFDRAAEAPILNTYIPIDFDNLYRIGSTQRDAVDKAAKEFGAQLQRWGEFRSPSKIDTDRWYGLTVGRNDMQQAINQMVSNPDYLKDAANRSALQSLINSTDYSALSQLQQSREGMLARQKANQELMLKGLFNPYWHNVDYENYDTLNPEMGIFNDVSPLAYKSEVDLVKPYVDNLKASWIKDVGFDRWEGVTEERTLAEVDKNLSAIRNTPEYAKHLETYMRRYGIDAKTAENQLLTTIYTAAKEFAWATPKTNEAALRFALQRAKSGETSGPQPTRVSVLQEEAAAKMDKFKMDTINAYAQQTGKTIDKLTPDDWGRINGAVYNQMANGIPEQVKGKLTPKEYFDYKEYEPIKIKPANDKASSLPTDNGEKYQFELGDMLLTQKGAIARDIPGGVFTVERDAPIPATNPMFGGVSYATSTKVKEKVHYDPKIIESALSTIQDDAVFAPNGKTFSYSTGDQNMLMAEGNLLIPRDKFKKVVEQIIDSDPEKYKGISAKKYMNILTGGYGSGEKTMQLVKELKGKYSIDDKEYSDLIEIKMARPIGASSSYNQSHNLGFNKQYQGTAANKANYNSVLGQSVEEATAGFGQSDSNF